MFILLQSRFLEDHVLRREVHSHFKQDEQAKDRNALIDHSISQYQNETPLLLIGSWPSNYRFCRPPYFLSYSSSLNSTSFVYTTTSEDTIFSIAKKVNRGACDMVRDNRMIDAEHIFAGFTLLTPGQVCNPDSNTCLLTRQNATATCVNGGPHDYKTIADDTIEKIALYKLNVTVENVFSAASQAGISSMTEEIPAGTFIKIRHRVPSACTVTPSHFTYGVYKDLAENFGIAVEYIMSFNGAYNYSDHSDAEAACITVPM